MSLPVRFFNVLDTIETYEGRLGVWLDLPLKFQNTVSFSPGQPSQEVAGYMAVPQVQKDAEPEGNSLIVDPRRTFPGQASKNPVLYVPFVSPKPGKPRKFYPIENVTTEFGTPAGMTLDKYDDFVKTFPNEFIKRLAHHIKYDAMGFVGLWGGLRISPPLKQRGTPLPYSVRYSANVIFFGPEAEGKWYGKSVNLGPKLKEKRS